MYPVHGIVKETGAALDRALLISMFDHRAQNMIQLAQS